MIQLRNWFEMARRAQSAAIAAALWAAILTALTLPAEARGGHGFRRSFGGHGKHGAQIAGDHRHGNDAYMNAASDETDKVLNSKLKSICRGC